MENTLIWLLGSFFSIILGHADFPGKPQFTDVEINHIRATTPGLFAKNKSVCLHFDSLAENEYAFPLPGAKVISPYGSQRGHSGVDIKTFAGDTVLAVFAGVVRMSKSYAAYGNVIVIRHSNGLETVYSHNLSNFVKSGDVVYAGQPIALTGRTGRASTEHLHFETRIDGQHFNPNLFFDFKKKTLRKERIQCTKSRNKIEIQLVTVKKERKNPIRL